MNGTRLKVSNGKPYCWYGRKVKRGDPIIAHRTLPCGTQVYVRVVGTTRGGWVQVGDRGPYGACARRDDLKQLQKRITRIREKIQGQLTERLSRDDRWRLNQRLRGYPAKLTVWKNPWCHRYGKDWVWYVKRKESWPGKYRGIADISHTARRVIGHNGWQHVTLRYWNPKETPPVVAQANPGLALVDAFSTTRNCGSQR